MVFQLFYVFKFYTYICEAYWLLSICTGQKLLILQSPIRIVKSKGQIYNC